MTVMSCTVNAFSWQFKLKKLSCPGLELCSECFVYMSSLLNLRHRHRSSVIYNIIQTDCNLSVLKCSAVASGICGVQSDTERIF